MAKQMEMIYEGAEKKIYATDDPNLAVMHYKDDVAAYAGFKRGMIMGKGAINNRVSNHLFRLLEKNGIETHLVDELGERETVVRRVEIIPVDIVVRNIAAGSVAKRLGIEEGTRFASTVLELCYKSDVLGDPLVNHYHVAALGLATDDELETMYAMSLKINDVLSAYLRDFNIELIDFRMQFGRYDGRIVLADEISPDTCRLWDSRTGEKLDKDRFRRDLGDVEDAYQEILRRLLGKGND